MRGITEERLREKFKEFFDNDDYSFEACVKSIIAECKELNPWQPIDENTPKDRPVLLFYSDKLKRVDSYDGGEYGYGFGVYDIYYCEVIQPTHWQELPQDPKEN